MPFENVDLNRRQSVWEAISELWLDTETDVDDFTRIAAVLAQSKYSLDELGEIFAFEVAPVVWMNSLSVTGVWTAFDAEWLAAEILKNVERQRTYLFYRFYVRNGAGQWLFTKNVEENWQKILGILKVERGVN